MILSAASLSYVSRAGSFLAVVASSGRMSRIETLFWGSDAWRDIESVISGAVTKPSITCEIAVAFALRYATLYIISFSKL